MKKVLVVGMAPYPVCLETGQTIAPGEIAEVELSEFIKACIAAGKFGVADEIDPPPPPPQIPATKTTRKIDNPTTSQETE